MVVSATLGMFIVDLFDFPPDKPQISPKIGGGGLYTSAGSRMFLQPEQVGMIVDRGSDWDQEWQAQLDLLGPCWIFRDDKTRLTTKARLPNSSLIDLQLTLPFPVRQRLHMMAKHEDSNT